MIILGQINFSDLEQREFASMRHAKKSLKYTRELYDVLDKSLQKGGSSFKQAIGTPEGNALFDECFNKIKRKHLNSEKTLNSAINYASGKKTKSAKKLANTFNRNINKFEEVSGEKVPYRF